MCIVIAQLLDSAAELWYLHISLFSIEVLQIFDRLKSQKFSEDLMIFNIKFWLYERGWNVWK